MNIDTKKLREVAEAALESIEGESEGMSVISDSVECIDLYEMCGPADLLTLLDRIEFLEKEVYRMSGEKKVDECMEILEGWGEEDDD